MEPERDYCWSYASAAWRRGRSLYGSGKNHHRIANRSSGLRTFSRREALRCDGSLSHQWRGRSRKLDRVQTSSGEPARSRPGVALGHCGGQGLPAAGDAPGGNAVHIGCFSEAGSNHSHRFISCKLGQFFSRDAVQLVSFASENQRQRTQNLNAAKANRKFPRLRVHKPVRRRPL